MVICHCFNHIKGILVPSEWFSTRTLKSARVLDVSKISVSYRMQVSCQLQRPIRSCKGDVIRMFDWPGSLLSNLLGLAILNHCTAYVMICHHQIKLYDPSFNYLSSRLSIPLLLLSSCPSGIRRGSRKWRKRCWDKEEMREEIERGEEGG